MVHYRSITLLRQFERLYTLCELELVTNKDFQDLINNIYENGYILKSEVTNLNNAIESGLVLDELAMIETLIENDIKANLWDR